MFYRYFRTVKNWIDSWLWRQRGFVPPPPHFVKVRCVIGYGSRFGIRRVIETGTLYGDMVYGIAQKFEHVSSVELDRELAAAGQKRFRRFKNVEIYQGDSGSVLPELLASTEEPTLFWLDGHYSGGGTARGWCDTPIRSELEAILRSKVSGHVILIDDARLFGTDPAYPSMSELSEVVKGFDVERTIEVSDDIIRICPSVEARVTGR